SLLVSRGHCSTSLDDQRKAIGKPQLEVICVVYEGSTVDEFHRDECGFAARGPFTELEYLNYVRMPQPTENLRLVLEAADRANGESSRVENFDRHLPIGRGLRRFVDDAHSASADLPNEHVITETER